ncbi:glutathione S-transferase family protein [Roseobacter sinensis]|uniref:Glutathione S-transferase family protein n=1 Tax=Roseobacter sinensis TaxID=2931391 RepID=A0ABT3B9S9_9RHOB|nr:glutathione S-transferase family protein [Roseobacter sp. WL0113]MCV3270302.1 glutathione S-transferase family protein [Roseobacter sp. WL0113]
MRLHYAPRTISVAVAITLEEAGLPYEPVPVDFSAGEQKGDAYLALNPKGRVPTLETDSGTVLTETGALLDYIAALAPGARLVPQDPERAAQMRSVMYFLASTMHVNHAHMRRGDRWATKKASFDDMIAKTPENMAENARYFTTDCLEGDYVLGDQFSIADPYSYMLCSWLERDEVSLKDFPEIAAYLDRMNARASVQAVKAKGML